MCILYQKRNNLQLTFETVITDNWFQKQLFTDTDSLFYHIKTDGDVYEDFFVDRSLFDNSDYPKSSKFFSGQNKKVIGKFKDEAAGKPTVEFIGLKSKMYSSRKEEYEKYLENKTAQGVKKNFITKEINHPDNRDTLFNDMKMHHQMRTIRSELHQISSYQLNKV